MTKNAFQYWLAAFITCSGLYIVLRQLDLLPQDWPLKITPIILLITYVYLTLKGQVRLFMLLGLILSLIGDVLLSLNDLFIEGLAAFLLAQLTYATLFFKQAQYSLKGVIFAIATLGFLTTAAWQVIPHSGELKWVVFAYMLAISLMAITAGFRADEKFLLTALGAACFVLSDTIIAINKFLTPFTLADSAIMLTYYLAQLMITLGITRHWLAQQMTHN